MTVLNLNIPTLFPVGADQDRAGFRVYVENLDFKKVSKG
ncbi:hypothetical protein SAMN04488692_12131 [Halarsenatibacter silvermanii]|uniref:Uncharacterized protein n=1 Tax=Halarsenatibacter silvermanii TaxID=321763 RepID=A0A1G9RBV8_9FIRM|nr:hypothetical protein SAMN04488692_12131 [Halarsenatibacter silvermanii]